MTRVLPSDDDRPVLVLGPNPTPNGGMHLGHIAGPYLAGYVYARYQRARGRNVIFTSETDDSQTYVVASAGRAGITPEQLCKESTAKIQGALSAIGISIDGFGPFDQTYKATVLQYFASDRRHPRLTLELPGREPVTGAFLVFVSNVDPWTYFGNRPVRTAPITVRCRTDTVESKTSRGTTAHLGCIRDPR